MSTEALRAPSLAFAVMFNALSRFTSPTMALCGSTTKLAVVSESQL
jgi:hypothetical protein